MTLEPTELQPRERSELHHPFYRAAPNAAAAGATAHTGRTGGRPQLTRRKRLNQLLDRLQAAFPGATGPWPWWGSDVQMWRYPCPVCLGGTRGWAVDGPWKPLIVLSDGRVWCQASLPMGREFDPGYVCRLSPQAPMSLLLNALELWEKT